MEPVTITRLRRRLRRIMPKSGPAAVVLAYHRVTRLKRDPQLLATTPERFEEQVSALGASFSWLSLDGLLLARAERRVPDRSVAITFDDGYADVLHEALPILERHSACGTVFVTAGPVMEPREFWWDELDTILFATAHLPARLDLTPERFHFDLTDKVAYRDSVADDSWNVLQPDMNPRQRLYRALCELLKPMPAEDRASTLRRLHDWAGTEPVLRPSHRPLTPDELRQLDMGGTIAIGAHTVTHQLLAARSTEVQREEVGASKRMLEGLIGHQLSTFAYPYGVPGEFTDESTVIVRRAGFTGACANEPGLVRAGTDPFRIPRLLVRNETGDDLVRRIEELFQ